MNIKKNLDKVYQNIKNAESQFHRVSDSVKLLVVSKTQSSQRIREMWECGQKAFGENYLQEALLKMLDLNDTDIEWHFIGPVQNNKTRKVAENFAWVHTIEHEKTAKRLSEQRPKNLPPLNICIQVNIEQEMTKSGVSISEVIPLINAIQTLPQLKLRGFMIIPQASDSIEKQQKIFQQLRELLHHINHTLHLSLDTLSMGMSNDYIDAIAEGATIVRLGTALFGKRLQ